MDSFTHAEKQFLSNPELMNYLAPSMWRVTKSILSIMHTILAHALSVVTRLFLTHTHTKIHSLGTEA